METYPRIHKVSLITVFCLKIVFLIFLLLWLKLLNIPALIFIFALSYIYIGFTSNDIHIYNEKLIFVNRLFFLKREFLLSDIDRIRLKHEWSEKFLKTEHKNFFSIAFFVEFFIQLLIPIDYKYIKLYLKDGSSKKVFCFGFEYSGFGDDHFYTIFENVYKDLEIVHKDIKWTKNTDPYFQPSAD